MNSLRVRVVLGAVILLALVLSPVAQKATEAFSGVKYCCSELYCCEAVSPEECENSNPYGAWGNQSYCLQFCASRQPLCSATPPD